MTNKMRPDELLERVRDALGQLRLKEMAAQLDVELSAGPRRGEDRLELLWRLLEPQLIARQQRSCQWRIRRAKLPASKSFDEFDFDFQPNLDRDRVMQLATLEFIRRGQNLLVAGMSGTGKSHICIAIGYLACAAGIRTRYTTSAEMLCTLTASLATGTLAEALKIYTRPPLLIIDEVGLDRPERESTPDAQLFYKVVRPRHQAPCSTILTSNIKWDDWGQYLGDEVATVAILDRLIEHGHLLTINGPSWRAHQHEKLNAAYAQPAEQDKTGSTAPKSGGTRKKATKKRASKKRSRQR
jgi:DNA replication protein DnaC